MLRFELLTNWDHRSCATCPQALIVTVACMLKIVPGFEYDMEHHMWVEVPPQKVESRLHAYTTKRQLTSETALVMVITNGKLCFLVDKGNGVFLDVNNEEAKHVTDTEQAAKELVQGWLDIHQRCILRDRESEDNVEMLEMDEYALIEDDSGSKRYAKVEEVAEKPDVKISATRHKERARARPPDGVPASDRELRQKRVTIEELRKQESAAAAEQQRQQEKARRNREKERAAAAKKAAFEEREAARAAQRAKRAADKAREREEKKREREEMKRKTIEENERMKKMKLEHEGEINEMKKNMQLLIDKNAQAAKEAAEEVMRAMRVEAEKDKSKVIAELTELKKKVKHDCPSIALSFDLQRELILISPSLPLLADARHRFTLGRPRGW